MYLCAIKLHETAYNDNDIDDRTADSTARHNARLSFCVLYEGANVHATTEVTTGLRFRCNGGSIGVVVADSCNGNESR